jgi:hypothetical protein
MWLHTSQKYMKFSFDLDRCSGGIPRTGHLASRSELKSNLGLHRPHSC